MSALPSLLELMLTPEPPKAPQHPRPRPVAPVMVSKPAPRDRPKHKPVPISISAAPSEVKPPVQTNFRDEPLPGSTPVLPEDRRFKHCTWPVKEGGEHKLCALDRVPRKDGRLGNYCKTHAQWSARRTDLIGEAFVKSTMRWAVDR